MIRTENLTRIFRTEEVETIALNGVNIEVEVTPGTLHVLIVQDIKMTYRISLLFCYSFYYYFHTL